MTVRTAVIVAGGIGSRFLPVTKVVPKELLPLIDRPLIQYTVEEALSCGMDRIILVTSPEKASIARYFEPDADLESDLEARKSPALDEVRRVGRMAKLITVCQPRALGLGDAVLRAREAVGAEPFIVYLPDVVFDCPVPVTLQVVEAFERLGGPVVAVMEVRPEDVSAYGMVEGEPTGACSLRLRRVVEKPAPGSTTSTTAILGPYVFTSAIFGCLEQTPPGHGGEVQLTDGIQLLCERLPAFGLRYAGRHYDCGTPDKLVRAAHALLDQRAGS